MQISHTVFSVSEILVTMTITSPERFIPNINREAALSVDFSHFHWSFPIKKMEAQDSLHFETSNFSDFSDSRRTSTEHQCMKSKSATTKKQSFILIRCHLISKLITAWPLRMKTYSGIYMSHMTSRSTGAPRLTHRVICRRMSPLLILYSF